MQRRSLWWVDDGSSTNAFGRTIDDRSDSRGKVQHFDHAVGGIAELDAVFDNFAVTYREESLHAGELNRCGFGHESRGGICVRKHACPRETSRLERAVSIRCFDLDRERAGGDVNGWRDTRDLGSERLGKAINCQVRGRSTADGLGETFWDQATELYTVTRNEAEERLALGHDLTNRDEPRGDAIVERTLGGSNDFGVLQALLGLAERGRTDASIGEQGLRGQSFACNDRARYLVLGLNISEVLLGDEWWGALVETAGAVESGLGVFFLCDRTGDQREFGEVDIAFGQFTQPEACKRGQQGRALFIDGEDVVSCVNAGELCSVCNLVAKVGRDFSDAPGHFGRDGHIFFAEERACNVHEALGRAGDHGSQYDVARCCGGGFGGRVCAIATARGEGGRKRDGDRCSVPAERRLWAGQIHVGLSSCANTRQGTIVLTGQFCR